MSAVVRNFRFPEDTDICYGQRTNIWIGKPLADTSLIPSNLLHSSKEKATQMAAS